MTDKRRDDASVCAEIETLEREAADLEIQRETTEAQIRQLREAEDPSAGLYYAQEIFRLSQEKLRLAAEVDIRRRKVNRLRLGNGPSGLLQ